MMPHQLQPQGDDMERVLRELRKQERTCIFIDNSNLWHAIRCMSLKNRRLNYIKFRDFLADGRTSDVRFYYSMLPEPDPLNFDAVRKHDKEVKFYTGIEEIGYIMVCLPIRAHPGEDGQIVLKEKGLDCDIVYDMAVLSRMGAYKSFILVAGDEDYARTVRRVRNETGLQVDVAFFGKAGCSSVLIREASNFIDLSEVDTNLIFRSSSSWGG